MKSSRGRATSAATLLATTVLGVVLALPAWAQKAPATADGTPEIDASITSRNWSAALSQLDARIAANPRDVQAQFKRGTVLARLNRDDDAIAQFLALTQAYPELPEPYNNLAALYAKHGRYDDARAALVTATQANPDYSLAYENLGDLYLRLASESYKRARSLGRTSGASAQRLADIERIIAPPAAAQQAKADKPAAASRAEGVSADATSNLSIITPPQQSNFEFNGGGGATLATPPYVAPSH
ncbi:tetratricopeptide repeat protein [Burkholderia gladioli]|uniref:tetratricopeptide repeat protein n=1 Tax=Burkholderia gladioli TaxID=28095 RepID=UPI0016422E0D|nr:tetratricopeptide repeat protein [Burkholderia gladioli]MBU9319530.1 tetratricopeptide repeat protein [Burkholderia gladioli]